MHTFTATTIAGRAEREMEMKQWQTRLDVGTDKARRRAGEITIAELAGIAFGSDNDSAPVIDKIEQALTKALSPSVPEVK
jgi:hypothetical protein